jgi:flagellar motor switch protein FliN/FliY
MAGQSPDGDPVPDPADSAAGNGASPNPNTPRTPANPPTGDSLADAALRAAQEAIAGLGDLASGASAFSTPPTQPASSSGGMSADALADAMAQAMLESGAEASDAAAAAAAAAVAAPKPPPPGSQRFELPTFETGLSPAQQRAIDLLADVNLQVKIELGRTRMLVEDVLKLGEGAVVELDKLAGDPVDVYVNDRHVARGEVLVLNDNFCVRISEIIPPNDGKESTPAA